jgi:hypothetical protein
MIVSGCSRAKIVCKASLQTSAIQQTSTTASLRRRGRTFKPSGYDAIWMSQFLDCFSERQIVSILSRCRDSLGPESHVYILEPFSDRQRFA